MTNLRKAAQIALDAFEEINKLSIGENAVCLPAEIDDARETLRQALAQPEQEPSKQFHEWACNEHQKALAESANYTTSVVESKAPNLQEMLKQAYLDGVNSCLDAIRARGEK